MATNTYVALDKKTVASAVSNVEFTGISGAYTNLILQVNGTYSVADATFGIQFNGDGGTNYSDTDFYGNGSTAGSYESVSASSIQAGWYPYSSSQGEPGSSKIYIPNYSSTVDPKTTLERAGMGGGQGVYMRTGRWNNTAAITSIKLVMSTGNFAVGTTFSLYGIAAEGTSPAAKATGGTIYSDSTYYYHVFSSTGVFTPNQALSAQILAVGGGGGGGGNIGAGGGAGAMTTFGTTSSLSNGVAYTCTVGAGGAGATTSANGSVGGTTSFAGSGFSTITALGGGYGSQSSNGGPGGSGGGGGPSSPATSGGTASGPNTFAGGTGFYSYPYYGAGGGGGATAAGTAGVGSGAAIGGNGGQGYAISAIDSALPATGIFGSMTVIASGGGGSGVRPDSVGNSATGGTGGTGAGNGGFQGTVPTASTSYGSGGGGASWENYTNGDGTNGYQGLIIVRYAKA